MQNRVGRFSVLLALVLIAPWGYSDAVAVGLTLDNTSTFRNVETQTSLGRREASARERQAAVANGRAAYASFSPEKKRELQKKKVRYLAVTTTPSSANGSGRDLMVFDTSEDTLASKYVYTVRKRPDAGSSLKLDGYNALYAGP